jgi:hypothetical protein
MALKIPKSAKLGRDTRSMSMLAGNPVWRAFAKKPVSTETQTTIGLASRKALYALNNGAGQVEHFNELVVTAYTAIILAEDGYGANLLREFHAALVTMLECRVRSLNGKCYSLDEQESRVVNELLELHEQQVQLVGQGELAAAIIKGYRRAQAAL